MIALHHVQVSCPRGGEDEARRFWVEGMGLSEVLKPAALAARGGCWFRAFDRDGGPVTAEIHVGVEEPFAPARKAHPAFVLPADEFDALEARVRAAGFAVDDAERTTFAGYLRFHCADAHGNRVEVLTPLG